MINVKVPFKQRRVNQTNKQKHANGMFKLLKTVNT